MSDKKEEKKYVKKSYSFKTEDQILNFGLHEGKTIGSIMRKEPTYIDWCVNKFKGFKLWKKLATRFEEIKEEVRLEKIEKEKNNKE